MLFGNSRRKPRPGRAPRGKHIDVELLSAYLDNQVTASERAHIEEHLSACTTCQQELNTLRQTVTLLRAMPRVAVPRAFTLSEAQVGIHGAGVRPAWPWRSALKGLAAATAVALVALVATTLLRQPAWRPGATIARVAPQAAPTAAAAQPAAAPEAPPVEKSLAEPTAAPRATAKSAVQATVVTETAVVKKEVAPAPAPTEAPAPAAPEIQPAADAMAAKAAETATQESLPQPSQAAEIPEMAVMATPGSEATPATLGMAAASGIGAGGGGAAGPELEGLAAEVPPPNAPIGSVLPEGSGVVYADRQTLWALDSQAGLRPLLQASEVNSPLISSDRTWIAYRTEGPDHVELWAVRWNGEDARLLLDERKIPETSLPRGYRERHIQNVQWIPGQRRLAVTTTAVPAEPGAPADYELWGLDVESGNLAYIANLGQIDRVFYAPDGKHFALLRYGDPQSGLWLFNADGTDAKVAVKIAAGAAMPVYDGQVTWLPDSGGLWAALTDSPGNGDQTTKGVALYRVTADGVSTPARHIDALDAVWSPDGKWLAYTRPISDSIETRELYLANADGSAPQLYATPRYWAFLGWSPDSKQFLYQDNQLVYLGGPDQQPQPLGNFLSIFDPRWITPDQFIHLLDQGTDWVLVSRWLDGQASSLTSLPRDINYDVTHP